MLAYFPDGASDEFSEWLVGLKEARLPRMKLMLEAMKELGYDIPLEDVEKFADGALGRPHLARAMIEHGIVGTISEAFDEYIGNGAPAFRERPLPTIAEAVEMVHQSGGLTSLAHPLYYGIDNEILIPRLLKLGVDCIEAIHNSHSDSYRYELMQQGMPISVGGDYTEPKTDQVRGRFVRQLSTCTRVFVPDFIPN